MIQVDLFSPPSHVTALPSGEIPYIVFIGWHIIVNYREIMDQQNQVISYYSQSASG